MQRRRGAENTVRSLMRNHLSNRHAAMAGLSLGLLAVLCLSPSLLGDRVSEAVGGLGAANPGLLWVAGIAFAGMGVCGAMAWRAALAASGSPLPVVDASARYAVGCGLNAIAPAHVGSAVRVALFGRVTDGGCWTVGGAAAAVGATRLVWLGALIAIGSAGGVLPRWPLLVIVAVVAGACALGVASQRSPCPPVSTGSSRRSGRWPPRRGILRSSPAGPWQARSRRSRLQQRSSPLSGSTIHCGPHSSSFRQSSSRGSSRSRRGTSALRALQSHSRSALRGSSRGRRCRRESPSVLSNF